SGSNEARNTMFELNLASRLHRAGCAVEIGGDADLEFTHAGVRWFGECKRPYKTETIERNLRNACKQLGDRLASSHLTARGLVAISVGRPLSTMAQYLEYSDPNALRTSLKTHVGAMVRLMKERMQELECCRRVTDLGLLIGHLIIPAWDAGAKIPTAIQ